MAVINEKWTHFQCTQIAELFVYSAVKGYDSDDFCKKFMLSDIGDIILTNILCQDYVGYPWMMGTVELKVPQIAKGSHYSQDILWFTGYLYKYWCDYFDMHPKQIYEIAPISLIAERFSFYHTQTWKYVINDIIDRAGGTNA